MFLIIVLKHEVIEIPLVLQILVERFNTPPFFVAAKDILCGQTRITLKNIYAKELFLLLELLLCVAFFAKFYAVLVVETTFFIFINVPEYIYILVSADLLEGVLDSGMLFA